MKVTVLLLGLLACPITLAAIPTSQPTPNSATTPTSQTSKVIREFPFSDNETLFEEAHLIGRFDFSSISLALLIFGGGTLLWVGGKFIAKSPKATYLRSICIYIVSISVAWVVINTWNKVATRHTIMIDSLILMPIILLTTWFIIKKTFNVSFGKAILAWLPTLGIWFIAIAISLPSMERNRELADYFSCDGNVLGIWQGAALYARENNDLMPPTPQDLIKGGLFPEVLHCPAAAKHRSCDYFYFPLSGKMGEAPRRMIVCDFSGNHRDGSRNVGFSDSSRIYMKPEAFQAELAKPENAPFAEALAKQERP